MISKASLICLAASVALRAAISFSGILQGERAAWDALLTFADALGLSEAQLSEHEPLAGAHAYTCYMAWLALYASDTEVAAAYLVNFPAWGQNCGRLSRILKERFGLGEKEVAFFRSLRLLSNYI